MGHRQRWYVTNMVYEVTIRTLFGQFWLRPDPACRAIIDGVFGKALDLYKAVRLHAYDAQSNHLHYLCSAVEEPEQLALFIDYVHGNIARQLNDLRGREGVFWGRRGSVIAVLDGAAQIDRLRYILAQGPKSNLVASPTDWPGACSTPALLGDMTIPAVYRSLDARRRNVRRPNPRPDAELEHDVAITLTPLPVWADRSRSDRMRPLRSGSQVQPRRLAPRLARRLFDARPARRHDHRRRLPLARRPPSQRPPPQPAARRRARARRRHHPHPAPGLGRPRCRRAARQARFPVLSGVL